MTKVNELKRPEKKTGEPYWDFFEVEHYMEQKYNFRFRDFGRSDLWSVANIKPLQEQGDWNNKKVAEYTEEDKVLRAQWDAKFRERPETQDYWHEMCDCLSGNGSFLYWDFTSYANPEHGHEEEWKRQLCQYYVDEFGEEEASEMRFWVSW